MSKKIKTIDDYDKNVIHSIILNPTDYEKLKDSSISTYLGLIKYEIKNLGNSGLKNLKKQMDMISDSIKIDINRYLFDIIKKIVDDELNINNRVNPKKHFSVVDVFEQITLLDKDNIIEYISAIVKYSEYSYEDLSRIKLTNLSVAEINTIKTFIHDYEEKMKHFTIRTVGVGAIGFGVYLLAIVCLIIFSVFLFILTAMGLIILAIVIGIVWFIIGYVIYRVKPLHRSVSMLIVCVIFGPFAYFM